ncbi:hypothetical protein [Ornithinimicrobium kibberense]|uniref:hypothetical protein n=1 Tax=Ornithinimicrobium kibberense TaxID=282060 RepID=UPI00361569E8
MVDLSYSTGGTCPRLSGAGPPCTSPPSRHSRTRPHALHPFEPAAPVGHVMHSEILTACGAAGLPPSPYTPWSTPGCQCVGGTTGMRRHRLLAEGGFAVLLARGAVTSGVTATMAAGVTSSLNWHTTATPGAFRLYA